jgi:hypothetical protein
VGITVFLLIWGPAAALMYFPLTTQDFRPVPIDVTPRGTDLAPGPPKELHTLCWNGEPEDHSHARRSAA